MAGEEVHKDTLVSSFLYDSGSGSDWHVWGICLGDADASLRALFLLGFLSHRASAAAFALSLFSIVLFISFWTRSLNSPSSEAIILPSEIRWFKDFINEVFVLQPHSLARRLSSRTMGPAISYMRATSVMYTPVSVSDKPRVPASQSDG